MSLANTQDQSMSNSAGTREALQQMMGMVEALRETYTLETEAIKRMDARLFMSLQDQKNEQAYAYKRAFISLSGKKDELKNLEPSLKQQLNKMHAEFSELSRANLKAMDRMQRSLERLKKTIHKAARDASQSGRAISYTDTGALPSQSTLNLSIGLNEQV